MNDSIRHRVLTKLARQDGRKERRAARRSSLYRIIRENALMRYVPWQSWRAQDLSEPATSSSRWTLSQSSITLRLLNNSGLVRHLLSFRCTGKRIHTDRLELDDVLRLLPNATLSALDSALKRFINLCSTYHGAPSIYHIANELLTLMFDRIRRAILAKSSATRARRWLITRLGTLRISLRAHVRDHYR